MMKNEISRRITSITLMGIMVAGGITFAVPGEVPQAAAQGMELSVSATASPHGTNTFGGPQVIEIVVDDPEKDETTGNPANDVNVNGEDLSMVQAATGKWYTYIVVKSAFEYGDIPDPADVISPTVDQYLTRTSNDVDTANPQSATTFLTGAPSGVASNDQNNLNNIHIVDVDGTFDIKYGSETITLNYDEDIDAMISVDRNNAPPGSQVHTTITDFRLNLDPTEADVWTFSVDDKKYRMLGASTLDTLDWDLGPNDGGLDITYPAGKSLDFTMNTILNSFYYGTGGVNASYTAAVTATETASQLATTIAGLSDPNDATNSDTIMINVAQAAATAESTKTGATLASVRDATLNALTDAYSSVMIFTETGSNTGVFESWDSDDKSRLVVSMSTGDTYDLDYDGESERVFVDDSDPELALDKSTWNSGDELTVTVTDENLNLNTKGDDDMTLNSTDIPVLILGDPVTLATAGVVIANGTSDATDPIVKTVKRTLTVDDSTHVGSLMVSNADNGEWVTITITPTAAQKAALSAGSSFAQYVGPAGEVTFTGNATELKMGTASNPTIMDVPSGTINTIMLNYSDADRTDDNVGNLADIDSKIVFDVFTVNAASSAPHSAIYRLLAEETAEGSGVFEATITSTMVNQLDNNLALAKDASYIGDDLDAVLHRAYTGSSSGPTVEYIDEDARTNALTHDGTVSLDSDKYNVDSEVTITLTDADLQRDTDRIDTYSTNAQMSTLATTLLNVAIGDCSAVPDTDDLFLRETAADSGAFEASFDVPAMCGAIQTTGLDLVVTYYDFRDGNSRTNESSDTATIGADTGSVELVDTTVYPVPGEAASEVVMVYVAVEDADYNTSSTSIDRITDTTVKITIEGMDIVTLGNSANPLIESATNSGVFEGQIGLTSSAGQVSSTAMIFHKEIRQGDIITVSYTDLTDASGSENVATDSATFDLRTATLQTDKSEYVIGQDALITLIEPDLNYDSGLDRHHTPDQDTLGL